MSVSWAVLGTPSFPLERLYINLVLDQANMELDNLPSTAVVVKKDQARKSSARAGGSPFFFSKRGFRLKPQAVPTAGGWIGWFGRAARGKSVSRLAPDRFPSTHLARSTFLPSV